jgi:choline dehydrogenase
MLSDPFDLARMRQATRHLGDIARQQPVQAICLDIQLGNSGRPLADLDTFDDAELDAWMLENCSDAQHGTGGCCMGLYDANDGRSVVDPDCSVRDLQGLKVIDASIMPLDCQANTNFTTLMIGEKMAARLRAH